MGWVEMRGGSEYFIPLSSVRYSVIADGHKSWRLTGPHIFFFDALYYNRVHREKHRCSNAMTFAEALHGLSSTAGLLVRQLQLNTVIRYLEQRCVIDACSECVFVSRLTNSYCNTCHCSQCSQDHRAIDSATWRFWIHSTTLLCVAMETRTWLIEKQVSK